ncbi:unnamed protein product [Rhizopus microsporus]
MQENQSSSLPSVEAILGPALNQLNRTLKNVADKYEKLTDLDGALIEFNCSFGLFLFGIQANSKTIQWEHAPTEQMLEHYASTQQHINNNNIHNNTTHIAISTENNNNTTIQHENVSPSNVPMPTVTPNNESTARPKKRKSAMDQLPSKKQRTVSKAQIDKVISKLPEAYRGRTESNANMRKVLEALISHPDGLSRKDLVKVTSIAQPKVIDCLKTLSKSKCVTAKKVTGQYDTFCLN